MKPTVFIGSSAEGLPIAEAFAGLLADHVNVVLWNSGVFVPGSYFLDDLVAVSQRVDFAVLIATADDSLTKRQETAAAPRDNVVLEYGLFAGILGRRRTILAVQNGYSMALPSDADGITQVRFTWSPSAPSPTDWESLRAAASTIDNTMSSVWSAFRRHQTRRQDAIQAAKTTNSIRKLHGVIVEVREILVVLPEQMIKGLAERNDFEATKHDTAARLARLHHVLEPDALQVGVASEFARLVAVAKECVIALPFPEEVPTSHSRLFADGLKLARTAWEAGLAADSDKVRAASNAAEEEIAARLVRTLEMYKRWWQKSKVDVESATQRMISALVISACGAQVTPLLEGPDGFGFK